MRLTLFLQQTVFGVTGIFYIFYTQNNVTVNEVQDFGFECI